MARRGEKGRYRVRTEEFPAAERYTVSGLCLGDLCFVCESRVQEIRGEEGKMLAWCGCAFPDDHQDMELL
jgi:hypothetical protein